MTQLIDWIQSDGGPLICMLASAAHHWRGTDGSGADAYGEWATDYERACSIPGYLGLVRVNGSAAIVLGDMPMATSIVRAKSPEIFIVRIIYANSEDDVISYVKNGDNRHSKIEDDAFVAFDSDGSGLVIFDSAYPGAEEGLEIISCHLEIGTYRVDTRVVSLEDHASFVLHRFERL